KILNNKILNNHIGIFSSALNSTVISNVVCSNMVLDFNFSEWLSNYGENNTCDNPGRWNDASKSGCTNRCQINKATDIFDVVEILEYLSGDKNFTDLSNHVKPTYYKFVNESDDINLFDAFALINKIVTER
ncbi:MAG: hypothetical protein BWK75_03735, partial [Candidatus Altiarchaeales archaeon A3]